MSDLSTDFFENNDHALRLPTIVLRDSIGALAVQVLVAREDVAAMDYEEMLCKLNSIIVALHDAYHHRNGNFSE